METSYKDRNVHLNLLSQWIADFFKRRNFKTKVTEERNSYIIIARPTMAHEIVNNVTVTIFGDPNDFTLKFGTGAHSSLYTRIGSLISLFGGGILYLRGVKSQEEEEKLERIFWVRVEEKIDFLASPASKVGTDWVEPSARC